MARKTRTLAVLFLTLVCAATLFGAVACKEIETEQAGTYSVTYAAGADDATGSAPTQTYQTGDPFVLLDGSTFTRPGYTFTTWSDGEAQYNAGATYTMPAHDVTFTAQWEKDAAQEAPESAVKVDAIDTSEFATVNDNATANWFASYTDDGLRITAIVADTSVYTVDGNVYSSDGVEVIFASVMNKNGYTDNTISVMVSADGTKLVRNMAQGKETTVEGLTAEADLLTVDGETLAGYRVVITMPYAAAGITQEDKDAAIAVGLNNATGAGNVTIVYDDSFGTDPTLVRTYIAVTNDDTFEENYYLEDRSFWGSAGGLTAANSWDLVNDNGEANASIEMTSTSGDNFIYMRETGGLTTYYAEVQLSVIGVEKKTDGSYDGYPKFGMTLFSSDGTRGVFYYVDAIDGEQADGVINSDSINLGYNIRANSAWGGAWTTAGNLGSDATSADYQNGNYITLGIYRQGGAVRLLLDGESIAVVSSMGIDANETAYIGLASFNLRLSAKAYSITTDPAELAKYEIVTVEPTEPIKTMDGSMDDWTTEQKSNPFIIPASDGSSVTVYAAKDDNGINIFYDVYHTQHKTTESDWWLNTNVEFRLGGDADKQYAVAANGYTGNVQYSFMDTTQEDGKYHTVAEIFIPYSDVTGYNANSDSVPAQFYFKVGGMNGNVWYTGDWWRTDDGLPNGSQQGVLITENGIKGGTKKTIDGSDDDWAGAAWTTTNRSEWAAVLEEDGLYVIVKLAQASISADRAFFNGADNTDNNWWLNQNIEVQATDNVRAGKIIYIDGEVYYTGYINDAAAKYTDGEEADTLVFEFFIASENLMNVDADSESIKFSMGGQLFADATSTVNVWEVYASNADVYRPSYTITFKDGDVSNPVNVLIGQAVGNKLPAAAGMTGYTFDGWYVGDTKIDGTYVPTENVEAVAKYSPIMPEVTFAAGDGTGSAPTATPVWNAEGGTYTLTLPENTYTNEGFVFDKWSVTVEGTSGATQYAAGETVNIAPGFKVTITAVWVAEGATTHTVTFSLGYEGAPAYNETRTVEEGGTVSELPVDPSRTGYRFDGWTYDGTAFTTQTPVNGDITVTAKWVKQVTVTFSAGYYGASDISPVTLDENGTLGDKLPAAPSRGQYLTFLGWFYGEDLATQLTDETAVAENLSVTAKWQANSEAQTETDYLFLGASTISTDFWYTYGATFNSSNAVNLAVPGTTVHDEWLDKLVTDDLLKYNPGTIVIHIGLNDINDDNRKGEQVIADLEIFFGELKAIWPQADIYYVTIIKNKLHSDKTAEYEKVNNWVKTYEGVELIDVAQYITLDEDGVPEMQWFASDGMHPSVDGYAVFHREIAQALGLKYTVTGDGLGDTTVEGAPEYGHTAGWKYDEEAQIWHHEDEGKKGIEKLMISDAYASTIYAEAKISVAGMYQGETGGKAGLAISSPTITYFFFINLSQGANSDGKWDDNYGSLAYRPETMGAKEWTYPEGDFKPFGGNGYVNLGSEAYDHNVSADAYKTLAVAKVGKTLYFFASGNLVGTLAESQFAADEEVTVSVFGFNTNMYAKDGSAITDADGVNAKLAPFVSLKSIDGSLSDWTEAEKTNPVVIPSSNGRSVTVYAAMDDRGVNVFYDIYHSAYVANADEWHLMTNVEMRLGTNKDRQYYINAVGAKQGFVQGYMHTDAPAEAGGLYHTVVELFVPYSNIEGGYTKDSAYVPAMFAYKTPGEGNPIWNQTDFWFSSNTEEPYNLITRSGFLAATEKTIDGSDADWADASWVTSGRATYATYLGTDGLYVIVKQTQTNIATGREFFGGDWWLNQNIEIQASANLGAGHVSVYNGKAYVFRGVTQAAATFTEGTEQGGDTLTIEFFVANEIMINVTGETPSIELTFGSQLFADDDTREGAWQTIADKVTVSRASSEA